MKRYLHQLLRSIGKAPPTPALDDFSRLALRHGTDKFGAHLYTPIYHELFAPLRHAELRILEVGVGGYGSALAGGAGLLTLADYFPAARVVGLDIEEKRLAPHPRITLVRGSQDDTALLDDVWARFGPFDIIIDDGSHLHHHVLATFRHLYPLMPATGIYVVEDTQTSFWPDYSGRGDGIGTIFQQAHEVGLAMQAEEAWAGGGTPLFTTFGTITKAVRTYRNLIVFERGDNDYPSNNRFDLDHPNVVRVMDAVLREGRSRPSPGTYMTRIDMAASGRRLDEAVALAREAVRLYPADPRMLIYAYQLFERLGHGEDCREAAKGLISVLPPDFDVRLISASLDRAQFT